jgi:hypothetical protein
MANLEDIKRLLDEVLKKEIMAKDNCEAILDSLKINGFHDQVEKIKNDEARHVVMVEQLMKLLS